MPSPVMIKWFKSLKLANRVFVSPDVGNVKRAQVYANLLGGEICIIDKRRKSGSETEAKHIIGDVEGKNVLMVDDMITTAGTVTEACKILRDTARAKFTWPPRTPSSPRRRWNGWPSAHSRSSRSPTPSRSATAPMRSRTGSWCSASPNCSAKRFTASITRFGQRTVQRTIVKPKDNN